MKRLPIEQFGLLVGVYDHTAPGSRYRKGPDDNHIYLWIGESTAEPGNAYECAVTLASPAGFGVFRPILQCTRTEMLVPSDLPGKGFHTNASCSYAVLGLHDADFHEATPEALAGRITEWAKASALIAVYGVTYQNGEGVHDIHLNSHETPGSLHRDRLDREGQPTQDGALVFFLPGEDGLVRAEWVFLKFSTQRLGERAAAED